MQERSTQPVPMSEHDEQVLRTKVLEEITGHPPTIGVIGISGVGKSSTVNTLLARRCRRATPPNGNSHQASSGGFRFVNYQSENLDGMPH